MNGAGIKWENERKWETFPGSLLPRTKYGDNRLPACSNSLAGERRGGCSSERVVEWCLSYPALLQDKTVINQHGATLP